MKSQRLSFGAPVSRCEGDEAPERQPVFDRRQDVLFRWTDAIPYPGYVIFRGQQSQDESNRYSWESDEWAERIVQGGLSDHNGCRALQVPVLVC